MAFNPDTYKPESEAEKTARLTPIEEGKHVVCVTEVLCKRSRSGLGMMRLTFEVLSNKGGNSKGKLINHNYFVDADNQMCQDRLYKLWKLSGIKGSDWDMDNQALMTGALMGKACLGDVILEKSDKGYLNARVNDIEQLEKELADKYPVPDKWKTGGEGAGGFSNDDIPF